MAPGAGAVLRLPVAVLKLAGKIAQIPLKVAGLGLSRRTWALFYGGYFGALLVKLAAKTVKQRRHAFDGMADIVSFSSCMIAGARFTPVVWVRGGGVSFEQP
jgi:hypothetical protein